MSQRVEVRGTLLEALPRFLTWRAGTDLASTASEIHVSWSYRRLRSWLAGGPDLFEAIGKLPESHQRRLVLAPQVYSLLRGSEGPTTRELDALQRFIHFEEYLCGRRSNAPAGLSALGDYYVRSMAPEGPSQIVRLPCVRHVVIDALNLSSRDCWPADTGEMERYSKSEIDFLRRRIDESFGHIESVSTTAAQTVESSIQVLGLMKVPGRAESCCSCSIRSMIGAATLGNFHVEKWGIGKLADAIVHEAIHAVIYKLELEAGLYTDDEASQRLTVVSPWSGRTLVLDAFTHACFVWFGLWNFWNLNSLDNAEFRHLRDLAGSGFFRQPLLRNLSSEVSAYLRPEVMAAMEEMSEQVRRNDVS